MSSRINTKYYIIPVGWVYFFFFRFWKPREKRSVIITLIIRIKTDIFFGFSRNPVVRYSDEPGRGAGWVKGRNVAFSNTPSPTPPLYFDVWKKIPWTSQLLSTVQHIPRSFLTPLLVYILVSPAPEFWFLLYARRYRTKQSARSSFTAVKRIPRRSHGATYCHEKPIPFRKHTYILYI